MKDKNVDVDVAHYYPSDFNREKKGTFYINTDNKSNKSELLVLSLHEGTPGHHYQIERSLKNKDLPIYLKYNDTTSYIEGWGLYSENLYEYKDLFEYWYKLKYELLRSCRLVLDTGIHYYGWNEDKCLKYMEKYIDKKVLEKYIKIYNSTCSRSLKKMI